MSAVTKLPRNQPLVAALPEGATVKLIGAGGVGGIVGRYGILYLAHLTNLLRRSARWIVIDGDHFEASNRGRMLFSRLGPKAEILAEELIAAAENSRLALSGIDEYVTSENIQQLLHNGDIILLTVDNHATRKMVSDYCDQQLDDFCLISGGNDGVGEDEDGRLLRGTYGNCQVFTRGRYRSPSLTEFHPEIAQPGDKLPTEIDCTEVLISQPQNLFANLAVASSILNTFWLYLCDSLHYSELAFDIADAVMRPVPYPPPVRAEE
jgi:hypothetical protein